MPKACDIKKGDVVEYKGAPCLVKQIDVKSPSSRGAATLYKMRFNNIKTKQKLEQSFKGDDMLQSVGLERRKMQFLYRESDAYIFMDDIDYSQHSVSEEVLGEDRFFIIEGMESLICLLIEEQLIAVEIPQSMTMTVVDTTPGIKGASASARTKPAVLETGLTIQVPEYLENGERVKVNTQEQRFIARA